MADKITLESLEAELTNVRGQNDALAQRLAALEAKKDPAKSKDFVVLLENLADLVETLGPIVGSDEEKPARKKLGTIGREIRALLK